ncbi:MAG: hypothetical protein KF685_07280 [Acidobacteria bacterium]|nr:hypothetical protein [Acidobacteriota bacterium]
MIVNQQKSAGKNGAAVSLASSSKGNGGYSIIEMLGVVAILVVLTAISIPYAYNYNKLYRTEDQALKIIDMMQEAGQRALTRRRTVRFEIDLTENKMHIIDEPTTGPHELIRSVDLLPTYEVMVDETPSGITTPSPPDYPVAEFLSDNFGHTKPDGTAVVGNTVWQARYRSNGSVIGPDATPVPLNATLILWPPKPGEPTEANSLGEVRALTLFAGSGAMKYWKYNGTEFVSH